MSRVGGFTGLGRDYRVFGQNLVILISCHLPNTCQTQSSPQQSLAKLVQIRQQSQPAPSPPWIATNHRPCGTKLPVPGLCWKLAERSIWKRTSSFSEIVPPSLPSQAQCAKKAAPCRTATSELQPSSSPSAFSMTSSAAQQPAYRPTLGPTTKRLKGGTTARPAGQPTKHPSVSSVGSQCGKHPSVSSIGSQCGRSGPDSRRQPLLRRAQLAGLFPISLVRKRIPAARCRQCVLARIF
jgi:hypothetical protein